MNSNGELSQNILNVYKTQVKHLVSFDIIVIRVVPHVMATIDIQILTDVGHIFRTVNLLGEDYLKWTNDDAFLYDFIKENIDTIFWNK
jgi:hypothetical protein